MLLWYGACYAMYSTCTPYSIVLHSTFAQHMACKPCWVKYFGSVLSYPPRDSIVRDTARWSISTVPNRTVIRRTNNKSGISLVVSCWTKVWLILIKPADRTISDPKSKRAKEWSVVVSCFLDLWNLLAIRDPRIEISTLTLTALSLVLVLVMMDHSSARSLALFLLSITPGSGPCSALRDAGDAVRCIADMHMHSG